MNQTKTSLAYEATWILITIVATVLVLAPIYLNCGSAFSYYWKNIFFIVIFITFTRWIFLLKYTFFAHIRWIKLALIFIPIPLFFIAMDGLFSFQKMLDETGLQEVTKGLTPEKALEMFRYIRFEYIFFATSCMIVLVLLPLRMIVSIWRRINRGTV